MFLVTFGLFVSSAILIGGEGFFPFTRDTGITKRSSAVGMQRLLPVGRVAVESEKNRDHDRPHHPEHPASQKPNGQKSAASENILCMKTLPAHRCIGKYK